MTEEEIMQATGALLEQMEQDSPGLLGRIDAYHQMVESGYDDRELTAIWKRYLKHAGLPVSVKVIDLYMKSIQEGFSDRAAKTAIRLGLSMAFGEHEYFSAADLAAAIGVSEAEAARMMEGAPGSMKVALAPWLTGGSPQ